MTAPGAGPAQRLEFFRQLQELTARVLAAQNIDEIMLDLSSDICELFNADRLTIYMLGEDKASMVSKVKTGLASFKQLKLPISAQSIAGYAALSRKTLNLRDVYDEAELRSHAQELCFQQGVDKRTGYRTEQMLVAPILAGDNVMGVVQLINNKGGGVFSALIVEGMRLLCENLATAFSQRQKAPVMDRTRFVSAIRETVLPRAQLDQALRFAASTNRDIEDVLLNETGLKVGAIGRALADYFSVPYLGFHPERRKPVELLKNFNREFVLENQWMPVEEGKNGMYILCTDPEQVRHSGAVGRIFPLARPIYCVTTRREFGWMVNQCFEAAIAPESDALAAPYRAAPPAATKADTPRQPQAAQLTPERQDDLLRTVSALVAGAHNQGLSELRIETAPGDNPHEIRFTVSGVLKLS